MKMELKKYRAPGGRIMIACCKGLEVVVRTGCDINSKDDIRRCAKAIHDAAPALSIASIEIELCEIDLDELELVDERGIIWSNPERLPDPLPNVMPYSSDLLPQSVGDAVDDIAERMQCPPDFPAAAMLVAMAAVIGCRVGIRPRRYDDWLVVPNLWGCVVGRPSLKKSPAIATAEKRVRGVELRDAERMADVIEAAAVRDLVVEAEVKALKSKLLLAAKKDNVPNANELAEQIHSLESESPPISRRIITTDPTIEKLCDLLNSHPSGMLLWVDELVGWMRSLDRDDKAGVRQQFLTLWNGHGKLNIDRIQRGETVVESPCISLFGCCTPGGLGSYVAAAVRGGRGDDGLIQRLQITVWPDSPREYRHIDRWPDTPAQQSLREVFESLADLEPESFTQHDEEHGSRIPWVRFDENAQEVFDKWDSAFQSRVRCGDLPEAFESHLSKYGSMMPSIALLLHLAMGGRSAVSESAAEMAVRWCEYLESHAARVYAIATCPERQVALPLLKRLIAWPIDKPIRVRSIREHGWAGLGENDSIEAALDLLMESGWVQAEDHRPRVGRPTTDFILHPEAEKFLKLSRQCTHKTIETPSLGTFEGFEGSKSKESEINSAPTIPAADDVIKPPGRVRGVM